MLPIRYGYVEGGYVDFGYVVEYLGVSVELRHSTLDPIVFSRGFKYAPTSLKFFQANEVTSANVPFWTPSKLSQGSFEAVFPYMIDSELNALDNFMFNDLPLFDTFELALIGRDMYFDVRFKERKLKVRQLLNNINEVTVSFIII